MRERRGKRTDHVASARVARPARCRTDRDERAVERAPRRGRTGAGRLGVPDGAPTSTVPPPPDYAPDVPPPRPDPAQAVPWGVRVAAEAGWRLLVLAGTLWVLMRVISAVQLVVFAFVIALLITALLQPDRGAAAAARRAARAGHRADRDPRLRRHGADRLVRDLAGHGEHRQPLRPDPGRHRRAAQLAAEQPLPRHRQADQRDRQEPAGGGRRQHRPDHLGRSGGRHGRRRGADRHPAGRLLDALPALRRQADLGVDAEAGARGRPAGRGRCRPAAWRDADRVRAGHGDRRADRRRSSSASASTSSMCRWPCRWPSSSSCSRSSRWSARWSPARWRWSSRW